VTRSYFNARGSDMLKPCCCRLCYARFPDNIDEHVTVFSDIRLVVTNGMTLISPRSM
jgi:hypothetical protein